METIIERVDDIVGSPLYHHTSEQRALDIAVEANELASEAALN